MFASLKKPAMTREEFKELYEKNNGFLPSRNPNHPQLSSDGITNYYVGLKEGCSRLIKNNPELVRIEE